MCNEVKKSRRTQATRRADCYIPVQVAVFRTAEPDHAKEDCSERGISLFLRGLCSRNWESGDVASMVSVDRAVVRMFSCEPNTVRWETRIADGRGLELKVFGPGTLRQDHAFADAMTLVGYQVQIEQQLLSDGYAVLPLSERRSGYDRRLQLRTSQDRRRQ